MCVQKKIVNNASLSQMSWTTPMPFSSRSALQHALFPPLQTLLTPVPLTNSQTTSALARSTLQCAHSKLTVCLPSSMGLS